MVKGDDIDCMPTTIANRTKLVSIVIKKSISAREYIVSFAIVTTSIFTFCFAYVVGIFFTSIRRLRRRNRAAINYIDDAQEGSSIPQVSSPSPINPVKMKDF